MTSLFIPAKTITYNGKILLFSLEDFRERIVTGDCCFICGTPRSNKLFNDEHVIPDWILRKHKLHSKQIALPNGTSYYYSQYKVPCCVDCNRTLGEEYEKPIGKLLSSSYSDICASIVSDPTIVTLLFKWLNLIYFKVHLKSNSLIFSRDTRVNNGKIGDLFDWTEVHHIHCIARCHYTGAIIEPKVHGTILILPALFEETWGGYDYADSIYGRGILLQLGDFAIIAILNDACACASIAAEFLEKINGPLTKFQLREILAHLNYINLNSAERPVFFSEFSAPSTYRISVRTPEYCNLVPENQRFGSVGEFLRYYVEDLIPKFDGRDQVLAEIEDGKRNYLFDEHGKFIDNSRYFRQDG